MSLIPKNYHAMQHGFKKSESSGLCWAYSPLLSAAGVKHGFTTRRGGVSGGSFDSLNLGWNRPEPKENIRENYRRLAAAAGFPYESMVLVNYCHGGAVERVDAKDLGKGFGKGQLPSCDGIITDTPGVTLVTLHADCLPVFLYDPVNRACAMVHAGWKGASLRVGGNAVKKMMKELGCESRNILAAIGPSICQDCFEVDAPVMEIFKREFPEVDCITFDGTKYHIDLWKVMAAQLMERGILGEHIEVSDECTFEHPEDYFSYRRDKRETGAMAGFIRL